MSIAGWLPEEWSKAVLPIALGGPATGFTPVGTAFLLDFLVDRTHVGSLITAKHVVFDEDGQLRRGLFVLTNLRGGGGTYMAIERLTELGIRWISHRQKDLAATLFPRDSILPAGISADVKFFTYEHLEEFANIREGDDVFLLGFPLSLGVMAPPGVRPIVRTGTVSLKKNDETYLIDANVFPGNSGSPVFFKPCPIQFTPQGLQMGPMRPPKLIGVVTSYVPYRDVAISQQTGRARIEFEENSGLGSVLSMGFVRELLASTELQNMSRDRIQRESSIANGSQRTQTQTHP